MRLALVVAATLVWTSTLIAAPAIASRPGAAGPRISALTYVAASLVCHQRPARSFSLHGSQLPVCARCLGLYVGASLGVLGWAVQSIRHHRRSTTANRLRHVRPGLVIAALPTAVTAITAWVGWWDPANEIRFTLALPLGAAAGLLVAAFAGGDLE
jgi:uncharacterized membrane protein